MQGKKIIILIKLMLIFLNTAEGIPLGDILDGKMMCMILRLNTIFTMEKDVHDTSFEHDIHDGKMMCMIVFFLNTIFTMGKDVHDGNNSFQQKFHHDHL